MMRRLLPLALLLAFATACVENDPPSDADAQAATEPSPADAADASLPPTVADAADTAPLPVEPPRMSVEPPPRRMPGSEPLEARCDADAARGLIGREATAETVEEARLAAGADLVRTLAPGQVITLEYHNSRLNLHVDERNVIVEVGCG